MRSTDEDYGSLTYDGAPLLRVPLCVSRVLLVATRNSSNSAHKNAPIQSSRSGQKKLICHASKFTDNEDDDDDSINTDNGTYGL